jgi:hypothetical protein
MKGKKIIISLIFILLACHKDDVYKIIQPGSYFPVYPNSWWKYKVNNSEIIIDSTSDNYILDHYKTVSSNPDEYSEFVYVPFLYSHFITGPIYGYDKIEYNYLGGIYEKWPILREEVGFEFKRDAGSQYPHTEESVIVKAKILNGEESVLILVGTFKIEPYNWSQPQKRYQEFVKDVGLVKDIIYDTITNDTTYKKILIDYHISK